MDSLTLPILCVFAVLYVAYRRSTRPSLAAIPGPEPESFILGNLRQLHQEQVGVPDFTWQKQFGGIARIKGPCGEDRLWIADPKALQHIYHTSGYHYPKTPERRMISRLVADRGLTWAEGDGHKRQRKVMLPAFGGPEARDLLPIFHGCAESITLKWKDILAGSSEQSQVVNIPLWLGRATLDAIGEAAFDYKFNVMADSENELAKGYTNLMADLFSLPSKAKIFLQNALGFLPMRVLEFMYDNLPGKSLDRARANRDVAHKIAKELIENKADAISGGKRSRDVMSILVRANMSENLKTRLTEEEMISQMRTILLAGQETTSNSISWALLELARHPKYQDRLRAEIRQAEVAMHARHAAEFTTAELDGMPFLQAVLKETLRFHPVSYHNFRMAGRDDVMPLSKPISTTTGDITGEVLVPKGTRLVLSVAAYNRDTDVWGEDAHVYNPERWLETTSRKGSSIGVLGNLLSFAGGLRACIGWRFAMNEMQAFLVELISNFEFAVTDDIKRLRREACVVMVPTLEGEVENGAQMPLRITLAPRED